MGASSRGPGLRAASSVLPLLRLPESEQGSGALQTRTHTRAHTSELLPKQTVQPARAHTGEKGRRQKEKKERGGGESQAAAAAAAGAEATSSPGKAGRGSGGAHPHPRQHLHPRSSEVGRAVPGEQATGRRAESRWERGCAGAGSLRGGRSRGQSRGQNEPRAGGRARRAGEGARAGGRGWPVIPGSGVRAGSARGLHLAARQTLGGGNEKAATRGFPFRVSQTKGASPCGFEARISPHLSLPVPLALFLSPSLSPSSSPLPLSPSPLFSSSSTAPQVSKRRQMESPASVSFLGADYSIFSSCRYRPQCVFCLWCILDSFKLTSTCKFIAGFKVSFSNNKMWGINGFISQHQ